MTESMWSQETGFSCHRKSSPISWPFYVIGVAGDIANIVTSSTNPKFAKNPPNNLSFQTKEIIENSHILAIQVISSDSSEPHI